MKLFRAGKTLLKAGFNCLIIVCFVVPSFIWIADWLAGTSLASSLVKSVVDNKSSVQTFFDSQYSKAIEKDVAELAEQLDALDSNLEPDQLAIIERTLRDAEDQLYALNLRNRENLATRELKLNHEHAKRILDLSNETKRIREVLTALDGRRDQFALSQNSHE